MDEMTIDTFETASLILHKDTIDKFYVCKQKYAQLDCADNTFMQTLLEHYMNCQSEPESRGVSKTICPECRFVAEDMSKLFEHFESNHSVEAGFSCNCGLTFCRLPAFLRHYIACPLASLDTQDQNNSKQSSPLTPTKVCDEMFKRSDSPNAVNPENNESTSPEASLQESVSHYSYYKHPPVIPIKGPSDDRPFGCPKCPKGFKSKSLLEQHMHLHYPPRYKCRWCFKVYRWPPVYYHHMRTCKKMLRSEAEPDKTAANPSSISIPVNDNAVLDLSRPTKSAQIAPKEETVVKPTAPADFTCPCGATFSDVQFYFKHAAKCLQLIHTFGPLVPPSTESNESADLAPMPKSRTKRFLCNICAKDFTSKLSLKQHVDGKHRAEGKYVCKLCGKRYRWGASFYYHRRTCSLANGVNLPSTGVLSRLPHISQPSA
ncbi:Zinc finger protein [Echinococcus granulosus]|uniref:Zinc finger protein n=1 Tax=Echinococcus granulosus TaxID=6210 RepID=U6J4S3_ECHGR|nr:Zinc finger protein 445 [Echinococcus granulosus]EUB58972.1 Zinc finger protein 445 [Echinococcus granulosus]KAH9283485.1 Zinc finger protein [Echinococcus granulosus]CDS16733.1 zinc finger protein [Echinococcus granulosus]